MNGALRFGSVCSGIEAASMAWSVMGWEASFFSEIEPFPCAVLSHHYPGVPNLGDMTKFQEWPDAAIDLLVGGTPCQSFSVAGLRAGLADPRGNLMLTYLAIAARYRPRWLVWENVPGVLSSGDGRDFGAFLTGLAELGYGFAYRVLDAQYVRVDGYDRAVPQRRRRVFVVGHSTDWRRAAAVLFDAESLRRNTAPRREARQGTSGSTAPSLTASGRGVERTGDTRGQDPVVAVASTGDIAHCLNAGGMGRQDYETETETMIAAPVAGTMKSMPESGGWSNSADHAAAGYMVAHAPMTLAIRGRDGAPDLEWRQDGTSNAILSSDGGRAGMGVGAIAFDTTQITSKANRSNPQPGDPSHPITANGDAPAVAFNITPSNSNKDFNARPASYAQDLTSDGGAPSARGGDVVTSPAWAVRRLTPTECERLQGFPDDYTAVPYRKKPAADGPRYKALGNSMAVNAMRWLGRRIELVEAAA